jgi:hypothetical protein
MTLHVSNLGRVRSSRGVVHRGHVRDSYHRVTIAKRSYSLHVLVARAFLGPPPSDAHTVDHIDMNPSNNAVTNLRWATRSQQMLYSHQLNAKRSKAVDKRALRIEARMVNAGSDWVPFESCKEAARRLGTTQGNIYLCLHGKRKTAVGHEFRTVDNPKDENESWVEVNGIHVSDSGRVRTTRGHVHGGSGGKSKTYLTVAVAGGRRRFVHVLVAEGFLGPRPSARHTVDHINNNPRDNRVANLRWATPKEQIRHSFDSNLTRGSHTGKTSKPVRVRSESTGEWTDYSSVNEAIRCTGRNTAAVHGALRKGAALNGLYFEYVPFADLPGEVWMRASV